MSSLKRSKIWMVLAFFAVIGVMAGPLLAFSCCCGSEVKSQATPRVCHAVPATVPGEKPPCHGEESLPEHTGSIAHSDHHDADEDARAASLAPHESQVAIGHHCQCQTHNVQPLTAAEIKPAANAFASVALALPVRPFIAVFPPAVAHWTPTQANAPPPEYAFVPLSGRAPPTF